MERDELAAWLRLTLSLGNVTARRLLAAFGLPHAVFSQSEAALHQLLSPAQANALRCEQESMPALLEATWQWLRDTQATCPRRILTLSDPHYPAGLLNTEDPPLMLYVMGELRAPWPAGIAVVGSRNPTPQGLGNAGQFARSFAQAGLTVVSGLALGVDAAAHEGALESATDGQLATIAV